MAQKDTYTGERPQFEEPSAEDFGEPGPETQEGQNRSPRQVESQAGRKPGFAKRTAGAKSQATRAALGGALKKGKGKSKGEKSRERKGGRAA
jgi:hypothetical protein